MNVPELLADMRRQVRDDAPAGTRWKGTCTVTAAQQVHVVAAAVRVDAQGRRREQYWCDGVRVERAVLLRLTCPEGECPHALQVRQQWSAFHGRVPRPARAAPHVVRPLIEEVPVLVGGQRATARPARFPCHTPCPHGAHPALTIEKSGFDLFEGGSFLGGGVTEHHGVRRPRLPSVQAAEAWLLARQLEGLAAVRGVRYPSRRNREPGGDGGD